MIHFRTLGAVELEETAESGTKPIAVQAKRLALVAFLALGGGRPRRRDTIVALFWPDLDDEHARGALRQALSYLRRTLGAAAVVTRGEEEIAIAPEGLRCDAFLFDEAIAAGRLADAMELYRGNFLEGLFVSDAAPELEQWIDGERARLRQAAASCGWSLADASRAQHDDVSAVCWGRRAAALAPEDEGRLRWLITLFDATGDRAGALEAYDRFAQRLAADYSAEPSAETKELIEAVRRRSVARNVVPATSSLAPAPVAVEHATSGPNAVATPALVPARRRLSRHAGVIGVGSALALIALLGSMAYRRTDPTLSASRATVAVLPIRDPGADASQAYVGIALTEQVIAGLARWRALQVIDQRTMMSFRQSAKAPQDIARDVGADVVLTSSVQRTGDSAHLTVQLRRADDRSVSWTWTSPLVSRDLLDVARRVADSVAVHTIGARQNLDRSASVSLRPVEPAALDLYIQGRYWLNKRGPGLLKSIGIFTLALDRDPTFALAYSGTADAYVQLGYASLLRPDDAFPKARAAAEHALQLDSTLAEPHATLGFVKLYYDWDWPGAEQEFRRALALGPSYATAHEWYGLYLAAMGRFDEAQAHEHRAQLLDPLSPAVAATGAWTLYYAGENEEAERTLRIALRSDTTFALGRFYLGRIHQSRGQLDSALAEYGATGPLRDWVPTIAAIGHVYGTQGRRREALAVLARLDSLSKQQYVTAYGVALVHASLGQRDSAFTWLERGVVERTHWMVWLRRDPRWTPIRSDPRFEVLVTRLKLPK